MEEAMSTPPHQSKTPDPDPNQNQNQNTSPVPATNPDPKLKPSPHSGIAAYYNANTSTEHARLVSGKVEFEISLRTILSYLPKTKEADGERGGLRRGLKIADIGGGTGRYAVALAKLGHEVTLLDLSPSELSLAAEYAQAEGVQLEGIHVADASRLFSTCPSLLSQLGTFDAMLLLGPLYHLLEESDRLSALRDAAKLLKPGKESVLFASFLMTFGHLRGVAGKDPARLAREWGFYEGYLGLGDDDGDGDGDGDGEGVESAKGKYTRRKVEGVISHHVHPSEIQDLFEKVRFEEEEVGASEKNRKLGLQVEKLVACESFLGADVAENLNTLGDEERRVWMDVLYRFAGDECVLGASEHLLAVARVVDLHEDVGSDGGEKERVA